MRPIKFRIYNKKTKSWIHGPHERSDLDGVNLFGETIIFGELLSGVSIEDLNEIEALQYTGLKDINKKEIFEGDILEVSEDEFIKQRLPIKYCHVWYSDLDGNWIISYNHLYSEWSEELANQIHKYKVIGNIFDNPEILK